MLGDIGALTNAVLFTRSQLGFYKQ